MINVESPCDFPAPLLCNVGIEQQIWDVTQHVSETRERTVQKCTTAMGIIRYVCCRGNTIKVYGKSNIIWINVHIKSNVRVILCMCYTFIILYM